MNWKGTNELEGHRVGLDHWVEGGPNSQRPGGVAKAVGNRLLLQDLKQGR